VDLSALMNPRSVRINDSKAHAQADASVER
jgi:hypothetical protein